MKLTIQTDIAEVAESLAWGYRDQLPFALARALTKTGQEIKVAEREEMAKVFVRPTPYTLNSIFLKPANKATLEAIVWIKDAFDKGTPALKFLAPEIGGGARDAKRFEQYLERAGYLPHGMRAVPGSAAPLDQYGNVSRGYVAKMLSTLRAFPETGYQANRTSSARSRSKAKKAEFFVSRGDHLPRGIWQRFGFAVGSAVKPAFLFVDAALYQARFNFAAVAERVYASRMKPNLEAAIAEAIRTAR